jgi:glycerate 2-kinase
MNPRDLLTNSFKAAVNAASPADLIPRHLPGPPKGRTLVIGAGKAAAAMAVAVENYWPKDAALDGIVVTRYGHDLPTKQITVFEAGHPLPDEKGEQVARKILDNVQQLGCDDLLLCLFSGGGSSLLSLPIDEISMNDLRDVTRQLLRCGASIQEINTVRKHLSAIQGGKLAAASQAPILALIISDVTGDNPTHIASGPCAPDPTTYADALTILKKYKIKVPSSVRKALIDGSQQKLEETPKPGSFIFNNVENRLIATANYSLTAAKKFFQDQGIATAILGDSVTGEAREVAKVYAALVKEIRKHQQPWKPPIALLSGGETTVTVKGNGRGGRNSEFLLSLAIELDGIEKIYALACDTDGMDGTENNAGAIITPETLDQTKQLRINARTLLANNDAYRFFDKLGDLVITGPTFTNVNDYRVILIL